MQNRSLDGLSSTPRNRVKFNLQPTEIKTNNFVERQNFSPVTTRQISFSNAQKHLHNPKVQSNITNSFKTFEETITPVKIDNTSKFKKFRIFSISQYNSQQKMIFGLALFVFSIGLLVSLQGFSLNNQVKEQFKPAVVSAQDNSVNEDNQTTTQPDPSMPSEDIPSSHEVAQYIVPPDDPRYIYLDKFGTKSRVRSVGLDKNGAIDVPKNIYDTGWFNQSARPDSSKGVTVIDGHAGGATSNGTFYNLKKINPGDEITIEKGNGQKITYIVEDKETYSKDNVDMDQLLKSSDPNKHGLNLISCTGKWLPKEKTYDQRIIVFAIEK